MAKPCKRIRRRLLNHATRRARERYGGIPEYEIDRLVAFHRAGEAIPVGDHHFINWLSDGRLVRYIYRKGTGVGTFVPLRGDELVYLPC